MKPFKRLTSSITEEGRVPATDSWDCLDLFQKQAQYDNEEIWSNDKYQVTVRRDLKYPGWPDMIHLSINLITEDSIHDWRDLQAIKNILVGEENEAVELYPAESRLVDMVNKYHLWVIAQPGIKFPFGFPIRLTSTESTEYGKQRPVN